MLAAAPHTRKATRQAHRCHKPRHRLCEPHRQRPLGSRHLQRNGSAVAQHELASVSQAHTTAWTLCTGAHRAREVCAVQEEDVRRDGARRHGREVERSAAAPRPLGGWRRCWRGTRRRLGAAGARRATARVAAWAGAAQQGSNGGGCCAAGARPHRRAGGAACGAAAMCERIQAWRADTASGGALGVCGSSERNIATTAHAADAAPRLATAWILHG